MNSSLTDAAVPLSRMSFISGNFQLITAYGALTVVTGAIGVPGGITGVGRFSEVNPLASLGKNDSAFWVFGFTSSARIFTTVGLTQRNKSSTEISKIIVIVMISHASKATHAPPAPKLLNKIFSKKLPK